MNKINDELYMSANNSIVIYKAYSKWFITISSISKVEVALNVEIYNEEDAFNAASTFLENIETNIHNLISELNG